MKVSVVISAHNEEGKIEDCLKSAAKIASEIVLINSASTDRTVDIAKKYTDKIFNRENNSMLNINKNFGFSKAKGEWILSLDADERVTEELASEILKLENSDVNAYYIPRKNIIFGKWIQYTGWYPDYQLRLFKKEMGRFEEQHVHEALTVKGAVGQLTNSLYHLNYENVGQFLYKMVHTYTASEADSLMKNGYKYNSLDIIKMPLSEFVKRFFAEKGYKDGMHGLVLSLLQAFYHFVVFLRLWEINNYPDESNVKELFSEGSRMIKKEVGYWAAHEKINNEKNLIKKQLYRIQKKILP